MVYRFVPDTGDLVWIDHGPVAGHEQGGHRTAVVQQNRGVNDILIACVDGLTEFPEAKNSIAPNIEVQLCIIQPIRNSMKYSTCRVTSDIPRTIP